MLTAVLSHDAFQRIFLFITVAHTYNKMVVLVRQANYLVYTLCMVEMNLGTSLQKPPPGVLDPGQSQWDFCCSQLWGC